MLSGEIMSGLTGKLRSLAHQQLEAREADGPLVRRLRDVVSTFNDLLGKPIRPDDARDSATSGGPVIVTPVVREQAPVIVYFDGKDQRTRIKVEELLNAREIKFRILDVTNDEAERSWVITAAKSEEFPIVVIAGTPVGGFHELMQLDVTGDLKKRVFGS